MSELRIDLNADLGERPEAYEVDAELMNYISSVNIACGGHAGDEESIRRMVELAQSLGVAVGAHPSFPDRANFGRVAMKIEPAVLQRSLEQQIGLLADVATRYGVKVGHVKPHGALYHSASSDATVAPAIVNAVRAVDPSLIVVAQYASKALDCYRRAGLLTATEAFADRAYESNGALRSRTFSGALLDENCAVEQAKTIVLEGKVIASNGAQLSIHPDTLCFHSDTPSATVIARRVREALQQSRVRIAPL
jgi:UPF0271 protein